MSKNSSNDNTTPNSSYIKYSRKNGDNDNNTNIGSKLKSGSNQTIQQQLIELQYLSQDDLENILLPRQTCHIVQISTQYASPSSSTTSTSSTIQLSNQPITTTTTTSTISSTPSTPLPSINQKQPKSTSLSPYHSLAQQLTLTFQHFFSQHFEHPHIYTLLLPFLPDKAFMIWYNQLLSTIPYFVYVHLVIVDFRPFAPRLPFTIKSNDVLTSQSTNNNISSPTTSQSTQLATLQQQQQQQQQHDVLVQNDHQMIEQTPTCNDLNLLIDTNTTNNITNNNHSPSPHNTINTEHDATTISNLYSIYPTPPLLIDWFHRDPIPKTNCNNTSTQKPSKSKSTKTPQSVNSDATIVPSPIVVNSNSNGNNGGLKLPILPSFMTLSNSTTFPTTSILSPIIPLDVHSPTTRDPSLLKWNGCDQELSSFQDATIIISQDSFDATKDDPSHIQQIDHTNPQHQSISDSHPISTSTISSPIQQALSYSYYMSHNSLPTPYSQQQQLLIHSDYNEFSCSVLFLSQLQLLLTEQIILLEQPIFNYQSIPTMNYHTKNKDNNNESISQPITSHILQLEQFPICIPFTITNTPFIGLLFPIRPNPHQVLYLVLSNNHTTTALKKLIYFYPQLSAIDKTTSTSSSTSTSSINTNDNSSFNNSSTTTFSTSTIVQDPLLSYYPHYQHSHNQSNNNEQYISQSTALISYFDHCRIVSILIQFWFKLHMCSPQLNLRLHIAHSQNYQSYISPFLHTTSTTNNNKNNHPKTNNSQSPQSQQNQSYSTNGNPILLNQTTNNFFMYCIHPESLFYLQNDFCNHLFMSLIISHLQLLTLYYNPTFKEIALQTSTSTSSTSSTSSTLTSTNFTPSQLLSKQSIPPPRFIIHQYIQRSIIKAWHNNTFSTINSFQFKPSYFQQLLSKIHILLLSPPAPPQVQSLLSFETTPLTPPLDLLCDSFECESWILKQFLIDIGSYLLNISLYDSLELNSSVILSVPQLSILRQISTAIDQNELLQLKQKQYHIDPNKKNQIDNQHNNTSNISKSSQSTKSTTLKPSYDPNSLATESRQVQMYLQPSEQTICIIPQDPIFSQRQLILSHNFPPTLWEYHPDHLNLPHIYNEDNNIDVSHYDSYGFGFVSDETTIQLIMPQNPHQKYTKHQWENEDTPRRIIPIKMKLPPLDRVRRLTRFELQVAVLSDWGYAFAYWGTEFAKAITSCVGPKSRASLVHVLQSVFQIVSQQQQQSQQQQIDTNNGNNHNNDGNKNDSDVFRTQHTNGRNTQFITNNNNHLSSSPHTNSLLPTPRLTPSTSRTHSSSRSISTSSSHHLQHLQNTIFYDPYQLFINQYENLSDFRSPRILVQEAAIENPIEELLGLNFWQRFWIDRLTKVIQLSIPQLQQSGQSDVDINGTTFSSNNNDIQLQQHQQQIRQSTHSKSSPLITKSPPLKQSTVSNIPKERNESSDESQDECDENEKNNNNSQSTKSITKSQSTSLSTSTSQPTTNKSSKPTRRGNRRKKFRYIDSTIDTTFIPPDEIFSSLPTPLLVPRQPFKGEPNPKLKSISIYLLRLYSLLTPPQLILQNAVSRMTQLQSHQSQQHNNNSLSNTYQIPNPYTLQSNIQFTHLVENDADTRRHFALDYNPLIITKYFNTIKASKIPSTLPRLQQHDVVTTHNNSSTTVNSLNTNNTNASTNENKKNHSSNNNTNSTSNANNNNNNNNNDKLSSNQQPQQQLTSDNVQLIPLFHPVMPHTPLWVLFVSIFIYFILGFSLLLQLFGLLFNPPYSTFLTMFCLIFFSPKILLNTQRFIDNPPIFIGTLCLCFLISILLGDFHAIGRDIQQRVIKEQYQMNNSSSFYVSVDSHNNNQHNNNVNPFSTTKILQTAARLGHRAKGFHKRFFNGKLPLLSSTTNNNDNNEIDDQSDEISTSSLSSKSRRDINSGHINSKTQRINTNRNKNRKNNHHINSHHDDNDDTIFTQTVHQSEQLNKIDLETYIYTPIIINENEQYATIVDDDDIELQNEIPYYQTKK